MLLGLACVQGGDILGQQFCIEMFHVLSQCSDHHGSAQRSVGAHVTQLIHPKLCHLVISRHVKPCCPVNSGDGERGG